MLTLLLVSCASAPTEPGKSVGQTNPQPVDNNVEALQRRAANSAEPERSRLLLTAMKLLAKEQAYSRVLSLAGDVKAAGLDLARQYQFTCLRAEALLAEGYPEEALAQLDATPVLAGPRFNRWQNQYAQLTAKALAQLGREYDSQLLLLGLAMGASSAEQQEINNSLWQNLRQNDTTELAIHIRQKADSRAQGWLELAKLVDADSGSLAAQANRVQLWLRDNPDHPASINPPQEIASLIKLSATQSRRKVAVLLPLSGPNGGAGTAVREGIMAAWLSDPGRAELHFYDTGSDDLLLTYQKAVLEGAKVVLGPLAKDQVRLLSQQKSLPVPIIALNSIEDHYDSKLPLYQISLSIEAEAMMAADRAAGKGLHRALLIYSQAQWSERAAKTFRQQLQNHNGEIIASAFIDGATDVASQIKSALHIDMSNQRAADLRLIFGNNMGYLPYRRQDVDSVFVAATPAEARSINPILAFNYADDIPVFSTSYIYTGTPDPTRDADLNAIQFAETPWSLGHYAAMRSQIDAFVAAGGQPSKTLYALGIDAYNLATRLSVLQLSGFSRYQGATGGYIATGNSLQREPLWASFRNGVAEEAGDR